MTDELKKVWSTLPLVIQWREMDLRWLPPLMELGFQPLLEEMSTEAWGRLSHIGWEDRLPEAEMLNGLGEILEPWMEELLVAATLLSEEGARTGPTGGLELWFSWLLMSLSEPAGHIRACLENNQQPLPVGPPTRPVLEQIAWAEQPEGPPARFGDDRHWFQGGLPLVVRTGPGCKQATEVDGWAPGRVLYVEKKHRQRDWGRCTYTVRCEFDGSYSLVGFEGGRTDLIVGDHWDSAIELFRALLGLGDDGHPRTTIGRYFRYGDARPFHVYRRIEGVPPRYACTVDYAPDRPPYYRILARNPKVASAPFLAKLRERMTLPERLVQVGGDDGEKCWDGTKAVEPGDVRYFIACMWSMEELDLPPQVIGHEYLR